MAFLTFYRRYIGYHQFWCIYQHQDPLTASPLAQRWLIVGPLLHLLVTTTILVLSGIYERIIFTQGSALSKFVDVIQLVFPVCLHQLVVVEAYCKRALDRDMQAVIADIERRFNGNAIELTPFNKTLKKRVIFLSVMVQLVSLLVEVDIIATITASPDWVRNWMARIFSFVFHRIAIFHCVFLVEYISSRLDVITAELRKLATQSREATISQDVYLAMNVAQLRELHRELAHLMELHNRRHAICILGTMTSFFVCLTIDLYWMYANLYYGDNIFILQSFLCGIPPVLSLLGIFLPAQKIIKASHVLGHTIHQLQRVDLDEKTAKEVFRFSLQVLQNPFKLCAHRFFGLDYNLCTGMIGAITTYMVIFVSFLPEKSIFPEDYSEMDELF